MRVEMGIGEVERESMNKKQKEVKKRKNENKKQTISNGGNSGSAVFRVFGGYTCDCR